MSLFSAIVFAFLFKNVKPDLGEITRDRNFDLHQTDYAFNVCLSDIKKCYNCKINSYKRKLDYLNLPAMTLDWMWLSNCLKLKFELLESTG